VIIASFFLLIAAQSPVSAFNSPERITSMEAADRASRCGIGSVTVRADAELQEDVLVATGATTVSEQQLVCIDNAASYYDVQLSPALQPRFEAIRMARWSAAIKAQSREWLAAHKLLDRLPAYKTGETDDAAFTREIEKLCGPQATGAFQSKYGFHALSPEWAKRQKPTENGALTCLLNVTVATGFDLGFIGNEQFGP